jgi:hypothetical protein
VAAAGSQGASAVAVAFEEAVKHSQAVIARPIREIERLAVSDNEIYVTYYQLLSAGLRAPEGEKWGVLRAVADSAMFPGYKEHIRFGALTLNGNGLPSYGECFLVLEDRMIAHRATVFHENSVLFMARQRIQIGEADRLPPGFRAAWSERHRLCVAKLAPTLGTSATTGDFQALLLREGRTTAEDDCVEVHVWGPLTLRSCSLIRVVPRRRNAAAQAILRAVAERCAKVGVPFEGG